MSMTVQTARIAPCALLVVLAGASPLWADVTVRQPAGDGIVPGVQEVIPAAVAEPYHPSQVLVRFREGLSGEDRKAAMDAAGVTDVLFNYSVPGLVCVRVPEGSVEQARAAFELSGAVLYTAPDYIRSIMAQTVPTGITQVNAHMVWPTKGEGYGARVAVLDTGVMLGHEDLPTPILTRSFINGQTVQDGNQHGTHCSGTVLGLDNDLGVIGVAPTAALMIGKVLADGGSGATSGVMAGADWASLNGAHVISMSLGGGGFSQAEADLYAACVARGTIVIAAAGNSNSSTPSYPGSYDSVICVAAVDSSNVKASFSNFGPSIDITAPGVNTLSTVPTFNAGATWSGTAKTAARMAGTALGSASGLIIDCGRGGTAADFPPSVAGNIAHIRRGGTDAQGNTYTFFTKMTNAEAAGARAVIISNNNGGVFNGTATGYNGSIPGVAVSQTDGDFLAANSGTAGSVSVAPGGPGYAQLSGTSMATPHVAGVAGLLVGAYLPARIPVALLRDALINSATDLGDPGRDDIFGAGLVNAQAADAYLATRVSVCAADYNRDGFRNLDDLGDFITDYYTFPAVPGGAQANAPSYAGVEVGYSYPCPGAPDAPAPYDPNAYRVFGYRVGYSLDNGNACPPNGPNLDNLGDYITLYYGSTCG
jgi:subtilisin family serine protease